jgi:hypothetical protein
MGSPSHGLFEGLFESPIRGKKTEYSIQETGMKDEGGAMKADDRRKQRSDTGNQNAEVSAARELTGASATRVCCLIMGE